MNAWMPFVSPLLAQSGGTGGTGGAEGAGGTAPDASGDAAAAQVPVTSEITVATGLFDRAFEGDTAAVFELTTRYVVPALVFLLILIVAYFVGKFLAAAVKRPVSSRVDPSLGTFTGKLVFWAIMLGSLMGALQYMGIGVAGFAAAIAAAGFAVGLAFQGSLSNFAAGVMLLALRPFKVGDAVNAAGITAKVHTIDLFYTVFDTFDNRRIMVPNSDIVSGNVENITFHPERRDDVEVGAGYGADLDATRAALTRAAESIEGRVRGEGRDFEVFLKGLGASSVDWVVRVWFPAGTFWDLHQELVRAVKRELDAANIEIPFPQMDVHLNDKRKDA